jgi:hypothetical protein
MQLLTHHLIQTVASSNSVTISWHDRSDDERGFKIFRDNKFIALVPANKTSYIDRGLKSQKSYKYEIRATDDQENLINNITATSSNNSFTFSLDGKFKLDSHVSIFIDSDNNQNSGYSRGELQGVDYLLEGRNLYKYGGVKDGKKWNWDLVSSNISYNITSNRATLELAQNSFNFDPNMKYIAEVSSADWSKKTIYASMQNFNPSNSTKKPIVIIGPSTVYIADEDDSEVHEDKTECSLDGWGEHFYKYTNN